MSDESIVLKHREPFSDAILPEDADELAKFMDEPLSAIAEAITGALAAGPKAWTVMTGHIVQGMLKGKLFQQVAKEIAELRDRGKIADDFAEKKYGFKSWVELLTIIDEEAPDEDKLEALKAMFLAVNRIETSDSDRILNYQLFQIAKQLTSGQLLLLKAIYDAYTANQFPKSERVTLEGWAAHIAERLGHRVVALVLKDEHVLLEQGLIRGGLGIAPAAYQPSQEWVDPLNARITDLGIRFCENLHKYQIESRQRTPMTPGWERAALCVLCELDKRNSLRIGKSLGRPREFSHSDPFRPRFLKILSSPQNRKMCPNPLIQFMKYFSETCLKTPSNLLFWR
jgi:hypothetical protein